MPTVTCVCGERQEAVDFDELFRVVRRHSDEAHADLKITDDRIRTVLDAVQRATPWDGRPVTLEGPPAICPLTAARADDYARFFDHDAFMDNPYWADCYCLFPAFAGSDEQWEGRSSEENRAERIAQIRADAAHGLLAYADEKPVAWCHAAPREAMPKFAADLAAGPGERVGVIACFVVAAPYRKQGLAARLLDAACDYLRDLGMTVAEGYPLADAGSDAHAFKGPLSMYLEAGFERAGEDGEAVIVRKRL